MYSLQDVTARNKELKEYLWDKGYYVQEVGTRGHIDYLIVTCAEPNEMIGIGDKFDFLNGKTN